MRAHVVALLPALLETLSVIEDPALNYLQMHSESAGIAEGALEAARLTAMRSSDATVAIDACLRVMDAEQLEAALPSLIHLLSRGTGLPTRAGRPLATALGRLEHDTPRPRMQMLTTAPCSLTTAPYALTTALGRLEHDTPRQRMRMLATAFICSPRRPLRSPRRHLRSPRRPLRSPRRPPSQAPLGLSCSSRRRSHSCCARTPPACCARCMRPPYLSAPRLHVVRTRRRRRTLRVERLLRCLASSCKT